MTPLPVMPLAVICYCSVKENKCWFVTGYWVMGVVLLGGKRITCVVSGEGVPISKCRGLGVTITLVVAHTNSSMVNERPHCHSSFSQPSLMVAMKALGNGKSEDGP